MKKVSKKAKRRMFFSFLILLALILSLCAGAFGDWKQIYENKKEVKLLTARYNKLLDEEKSLEAEVIKFNNPDYVARYAREKYLYSLPEELIIRIPKK